MTNTLSFLKGLVEYGEQIGAIGLMSYYISIPQSEINSGRGTQNLLEKLQLLKDLGFNIEQPSDCFTSDTEILINCDIDIEDLKKTIERLKND